MALIHKYFQGYKTYLQLYGALGATYSMHVMFTALQEFERIVESPQRSSRWKVLERTVFLDFTSAQRRPNLAHSRAGLSYLRRVSFLARPAQPPSFGAGAGAGAQEGRKGYTAMRESYEMRLRFTCQNYAPARCPEFGGSCPSMCHAIIPNGSAG